MLVGALLLLVPLSAVFELPAEREVKEGLGFDYPAGCGDIRDRGRFGAWRRERPIASAIDEPGVVKVGGSIYFVGGIASSEGTRVESVATFRRYDLRSRRSVTLPPLPERLNHVGIASAGGDIYVVGGFRDRLDPVETTDHAWRYRMARRRWERLAPMPTRRGALGLAQVSGKIYAIGGLNDRGALTAVEAYDLPTGRWSQHSPMPTAREHLAVAVHGGQIYAVAGRRPGGIAFDAFERYDPATDRWARLPRYPLAISGLRMAAVSDRLVASGGEHPGDSYVSGQVWAYRPAARAWSRLPSLPIPKHGHASVTSGRRLLVLGGSTCVGFKPTRSSESLRIPPAR